jgi:hypothetical protein
LTSGDGVSPVEHGPSASAIDASVYGFIANFYFHDIETPLKQFVQSRENVVRHHCAIHDAVKALARCRAASARLLQGVDRQWCTPFVFRRQIQLNEGVIAYVANTCSR